MSAGQHISHRFTIKVIIGMVAGILVGLLIKWLPLSPATTTFLINDIFKVGGRIFLNLIMMLVVPIVLVSLICGSSALGDLKHLGRVGGRAVLLYLLTTVIAITIALLIASLLQVGHGMELQTPASFVAQAPQSFRQVIINIFPSNPFQAMVQGHMLQIIVFAILFGMAITVTGGDAANKLTAFFNAVNTVLMKLIVMVMQLTPYGVFCLLAALFAKIGFALIGDLLIYFVAVLLVLFIQLLAVYPLMLSLLGRLNPLVFFKKMYTAMLFAFSVSSSSASIPLVLRTVEYKLGVSNRVAAFIVPLGSTINMDGTAIMQGVATVFIANIYGIHIGLMGYIMVIAMATLASIGTAGVPSVGLITLSLVLNQVGLPAQGIALIIGVDRLLDMVRTAVNISGDSMIACLIGKSENALDQAVYQDPEAGILK